MTADAENGPLDVTVVEFEACSLVKQMEIVEKIVTASARVVVVKTLVDVACPEIVLADEDGVVVTETATYFGSVDQVEELAGVVEGVVVDGSADVNRVEIGLEVVTDAAQVETVVLAVEIVAAWT